MKRFKMILTAMRIFVTLLFAANVIFMVQLYDSIKERYIDDVRQCLSRADQIEIVDRIVDAGLADENGVVVIELGLVKSDIGTAMTVEELRKSGYSQGYRRVDKQIISEITNHLHEFYGNRLDRPDISNMEEAFRRDLGFSGYYPEYVHIVAPGDVFECPSDLWEIEYRVNGELTYYAYISPLTKNILREMKDVIATSILIALALTFGFWYLLHVIRRLRTIEEMKDDFTNNMTHELKTPIAIAYAANDALLQFPDGKDEERTKKYLTAALEQLSKLAGLVENILAMSMERRKHLSMTKEKINLHPFLTSLIEQQKLKADCSCEITLDCPEDAEIDADPSHFSNVICNLIDNSIKYSRDAEGRPVNDNVVSVVITADRTKLSVSDNGIGIPFKSLPYIFNKFYRVPTGNRSDVRGYGIGLFYVKSIVDKHGWSIEVESRPGKGSKFTIRFNK